MSGGRAGCDRILQEPFVGTWRPEFSGLILSGCPPPGGGMSAPPPFWVPGGQASPAACVCVPGLRVRRGPGRQLCWVWFREPPGAAEGKHCHRSPGGARRVDRVSPWLLSWDPPSRGRGPSRSPASRVVLALILQLKTPFLRDGQGLGRK